MTALPEEKFITEEEYAAMEERAAVKHEYYKGRMYAMAGATRAHNEITRNAMRVLSVRLDGGGCQPLGSDQRVRIEATGLHTYPDISVYCQDSRFEGREDITLLDPRLIIEVLSPSTENYDKGDKLEHYFQVPALQHVLIVDPRRVLVDHWQRSESGDWSNVRYYFRTDVLQLRSLEVELPLEELYRYVEVPDGLLVHPTLHDNAQGEDENL